VNLGENFSDSFEYVKKMFSDAGRLIILIVLSIIPIVEWIVLGYMARVLKESPGNGTPPKLENYGQLFVDGAKIFFATLVYMLVPSILIIVGGFGTFAGLTSFQGPMVAPAFLVGGTGLVLLLVGIILAIVLSIILGMGLAHMIKTGKFGKAFAFGEIFGTIRNVGWLKYLGWIIVTVIISLVLLAIAGVIPIIGSIIAAIIQPLLYVFIFRSLGLLYNDGALPGLKVQAPAVTGLVCASCGTPLQPQQKFCPNCGAAAPTPPPVIQSGTKFCISCGAKIPSTATFCGVCGAKQT
jgi:RNA polymerase subunit RPABC4/transcription elongation factor Spt4